ncbi:fluoride efflux transporter CrcB [Nonomuraea sp. NPDC059194]|uniref:fluoride efflux transporter CrcB n=1 Tax=Nonomuraea sp. NPDC059194 TaxID=3346764 RepID=UPI003684654A
MSVLLVALGAAVGAPLRYLMDRWIQARLTSPFPWGTLAVNVTGCAVLGFLAAAQVSSGVMTLAGTGFCGALTTWSTLGFETVRLAEEGMRPLAVANVVISVLAGLGAATLGGVLAIAIG